MASQAENLTREMTLHSINTNKRFPSPLPNLLSTRREIGKFQIHNRSPRINVRDGKSKKRSLDSVGALGEEGLNEGVEISIRTSHSLSEKKYNLQIKAAKLFGEEDEMKFEKCESEDLH